MPDPSFSIVIPTYQRRELVCDSIRTLSRLDYPGKVEIIIVIDGSTDGTGQALAKLRCPFPLRVIEQENGGLAVARNRGAAEATGEILLFLDDDMTCRPDLLKQHARLHNAGADAVTGEIPLHPDSPPGMVTEALAKAAAWKRQPPLSAFDVYGGHLSISKRVFNEVGGFDQELHAGGYGGEDLDFGLRLVGRYDVRHNADAIAWQRSVIGPRQHMKRARQLAHSDLRLIRKHPQVASELLANRGAPPSGKIPLSLKLSRAPLLPVLASQAAEWSAELAQAAGIHRSPGLARFYFAARSMAYWSALRRAAGEASFREWLRL